MLPKGFWSGFGSMISTLYDSDGSGWWAVALCFEGVHEEQSIVVVYFVVYLCFGRCGSEEMRLWRVIWVSSVNIVIKLLNSWWSILYALLLE